MAMKQQDKRQRKYRKFGNESAEISAMKIQDAEVSFLRSDVTLLASHLMEAQKWRIFKCTQRSSRKRVSVKK